jgi:steroid 5-alpha reductase family enzyme
VTTPERATEVPYSHPAYGRFQVAESMLFYLGVQALIGRAKVHNTTPGGFAEELGRSPDSTIGDAWRRGFVSAAADSALGGAETGFKSAYIWSLLGDWTLRLTYDRVANLPESVEEQGYAAASAWVIANT